MTRLRNGSIIACALCWLALPAHAQTEAAFGAFSALVKRIDNLGVYAMTSVPRLRATNAGAIDPSLSAGVGFELILMVTEWGAPPPTGLPAVGRLTEIEVVNGDTIRRYAPPVAAPQHHPWALELGFAYNDQPIQLVGSDYEIRGALKDQPAISLYLSYEGKLSGYGGVRFSSYNLSGARAFVDPEPGTNTMRVIPVSASTFAMGGVLGISVPVYKFNVFAESELARRSFQSLQWPDNTPGEFPRSLRVAGPTLWVGITIDMEGVFRS